MDENWVKIPVMAKELGVSTKTVYNWINMGKLYMPRPGYVHQLEAYEVWLQQKSMKVIQSYFQSKGIIRDSYGRFVKDFQKGEESGGKGKNS